MSNRKNACKQNLLRYIQDYVGYRFLGLKRGGRRWRIYPERRLWVAIKKIAVHLQYNVKSVIFELELLKMAYFRG